MRPVRGILGKWRDSRSWLWVMDRDGWSLGIVVYSISKCRARLEMPGCLKPVNGFLVGLSNHDAFMLGEMKRKWESGVAAEWK